MLRRWPRRFATPRNIPLALFGGIGILIVLYLAANFAYYGALSMTELAASGEHAAETMASKLLGPLGATIVTAIVMCSAFGAINSNLLISPRVAFAMGRDGLFFRGLGRVHANHQTPAVAIVVQALMAMALVVVSGLLKTLMAGVDASATPPGLLRKVIVTLQQESIFTLLTNFVIFAASIFYMLCVLSVFILRRKRPDWPRPYRTWFYPLAPLLFLGFYAWFMFKICEQKPFEACAGLALIGLGLPVHWAWQYRQRRRSLAEAA